MLRLAAVLATLLFSTAVLAETGELWDYSVRSSMMPAGMPESKMTLCKKAGWTQPPQQKGAERCQTTEFKRSGDRMTWAMKCPDGEGHGEMTFHGEDDFKGTMAYQSKQGSFTSNTTGHRKGRCELQAGEDMRVEAMNMPGMGGQQLSAEQMQMIQKQMREMQQKNQGQ